MLTHRITKNIGRSNVLHTIDSTVPVDIKRVLICRPNHRLGNLLLITPLVEDVIATFPDCKIDLFVKGNLGPIVFQNYKNVDQIIRLPKKHFKEIKNYILGWTSLKMKKYDLVINVDKNSSSGRLSAQFAPSKYKFFGDENENLHLKHDDYRHMAKYPVYHFRDNLTQLGLKANEAPVPTLNLKLSPDEIAEGKKALQKIVPNDKKTIGIFTYATGDKCYSEDWWAVFYQRLQKEYSNYNLIEILPVENVSQIAFKAPTFYSKDIREIGALIANTVLFIGADSGIMHLASASQTPTIGLFSVTDPGKYEPYGNHSVAINTNKSDTEECIQIINAVLAKI